MATGAVACESSGCAQFATQPECHLVTITGDPAALSCANTSSNTLVYFVAGNADTQPGAGVQCVQLSGAPSCGSTCAQRTAQQTTASCSQTATCTTGLACAATPVVIMCAKAADGCAMPAAACGGAMQSCANPSGAMPSCAVPSGAAPGMSPVMMPGMAPMPAFAHPPGCCLHGGGGQPAGAPAYIYVQGNCTAMPCQAGQPISVQGIDCCKSAPTAVGAGCMMAPTMACPMAPVAAPSGCCKSAAAADSSGGTAAAAPAPMCPQCAARAATAISTRAARAASTPACVAHPVTIIRQSGGCCDACKARAAQKAAAPKPTDDAPNPVSAPLEPTGPSCQAAACQPAACKVVDRAGTGCASAVNYY